MILGTMPIPILSTTVLSDYKFSYINQQFCITSHPLKKVIITESTREVLFLQTDWCQQLRMATTAPLPLPQRRSRRLRGQKPLSPRCRQVEEEWSGASPTPPVQGGRPFRGLCPVIDSNHHAKFHPCILSCF